MLCLGNLLLGVLGHCHFHLRGLGPLLDAIPSLQFNCIFSLEALTSGQLQMKCSGYCDGSSASPPLGHPSWPVPRHTMNSSVIPLMPSGSFFLPLLQLSSSKCAMHTAAILDTSWFPLSFCKGKKLVAFGLPVLSITWPCGFWDNSMDSSFSASLAALR